MLVLGQWLPSMLLLIALNVGAHGFDERYDLPAPLSYFVVGAVLAVGLSFVLAVFLGRANLQGFAQKEQPPISAPIAPYLTSYWLGFTRIIGLTIFLVILVAAFFGTQDPLMNLVPTIIWIIWWIGFSLLVACVGDIWIFFDPWRSLHHGGHNLITNSRNGREIHGLNWHWPSSLGQWPAVLLLVIWAGLEIIYPIATSPFKVGQLILLWTLVSLIGMFCWRPAKWQHHADVFAIYFSVLGARANASNQCMKVSGSDGFVIAMLSTVLFDGLHGGQAWLIYEKSLQGIAANWLDTNGYLAGALGLVLVWVILYCAYRLSCMLSIRLLSSKVGKKAPLKAPLTTSAEMARYFAPTLVPIAISYSVARNISSLLIQGQNFFALMSDPFGFGWDVFGTANRRANIGLIDVKWTWIIALCAIVAGHVVSVCLSHGLALKAEIFNQRATQSVLPLTLLMLAITAISLLVLAEPMVIFVAP